MAFASSDIPTLANETSPSRVPAGSVAGTAPASTPAARSASASRDASASRCVFFTLFPPVPEPEGTTNASHALTGTMLSNSASTIEASAAYAAAEAARVAANRAEARASSSPGGSASRWSRTAKNATRRNASFFSGSGSGSSAFLRAVVSPSTCSRRFVSVSSSASVRTSRSCCVGATSASSSASSRSESISVSPPSSSSPPSFSKRAPAFFGARFAANAAMRLCPGSSVPSSANDAHGSSFPAFRDCVTHAGCTTGGWFRSAFFNAASLAAVNPAQTTCVTATRE